MDTIVDNVTPSNVGTEPPEVVQSWAQMLHNVTSSVQQVSSIALSSSSELDDNTTNGGPLLSNGPQDKPSTISKVGKKAKVRKHAKKKKKVQGNQDEKKREISKSKRKDITEEQLQDSKLSSEVKSEGDSDCHVSGKVTDDKIEPIENQDRSEDVNKVKIRLEAQISARKGFGVLPSQEVVYDKVCTVLCLHIELWSVIYV